MLDSIIYRTLDWLIPKLQSFREWMIKRSLPKGENASEWAKKNAKRK